MDMKNYEKQDGMGYDRYCAFRCTGTKNRNDSA